MDVFPLYHLNCVSCRVRLPAQSCALRERSSHHWGDPSVSSTSAGQKPPAVSLQGTITSQNNHLCVSVFNQFHTLTQSKSLHMQYLTLWAIKPFLGYDPFGANVNFWFKYQVTGETQIVCYTTPITPLSQLQPSSSWQTAGDFISCVCIQFLILWIVW